MPTNKNYIKIDVLKIVQNIGEFYVGVCDAKTIKKICFAEERRAKWDDLEKYIGMQRPLSGGRVKEIQEYIKTKDATFPNSIILALKKDSYSIKKGKLSILKKNDSSNILDGQHRLAGFEKEFKENFDLVVTFFPDLEIEDQAYLFSVINTKQTKINPSLAQELYALAKLKTPQKIAHNMTVEFNNDQKSPWYHLIKILGRTGPFGEEILSQSTFSKKIIELICNPNHSYQIRDFLKKNENNRIILKGKFKYNLKRRIFWNPYIEERDDFIYKVLNSFFNAVRDTFKDEWGDKRFILTKTTGYTAMMKLFIDLYLIGFKSKSLTYNFFLKYLKQIKESGALSELVSKNYSPGVKGEGLLYRDFTRGLK